MKIAIIGGGIAGLSAGIYAQKNGFESIILEKNEIVGGECTGWDRKGYHIDGCIEWMTGTNEGNALNDVWKETGALDGVEIIKPDYAGVYERGGISLTRWRDIARYQTEMTAISPEDKPLIDEFFSAIRCLQHMQIPARKPFDLMNPFEFIALGFSMLKIGRVVNKYSKISVEDFANRFKSDFLRSFLIASLRARAPLSSLQFVNAAFCFGVADVPKGRSRAMAQRMEERFRSFGGTVHVGAAVRKIIVESDKVIGVQLENGDIIHADYVIPACDIHVTKTLLENRYAFTEYDRYDAMPADYLVFSCVYISLGISDTCANIPERIMFECEPYTAGITQTDYAGIKTYFHDNFAPAGKTIAVSYIDQTDVDCNYWLDLYKNRDAYKKAKAALAAQVVSRIEKRFPSLAGKIEVLDVATPATYNRYTGAYKGAWMSYMPIAGAKSLEHNGKIAGLRNMYVSGQWMQTPGGLPIAVLQGKFAIQRLCKDLKKAFIGVQ